MRVVRYDWAGAVLGVVLALVATAIAALDLYGEAGVAAFLAAQRGEPLLWLVDTAPFVAGAFGWALERQRRVIAEQRATIAKLELQRRSGAERTAAEISRTALNLLDGVSALGAASARLTESVRGTISTMTALSHKATAVALAAETVAGRALDAASSAAASEELSAKLHGATAGAKEIAAIAQAQMDGIDQVLAAMNDIHFATEAAEQSAREIGDEAQALVDHAAELRSGREEDLSAADASDDPRTPGSTVAPTRARRTLAPAPAPDRRSAPDAAA